MVRLYEEADLAIDSADQGVQGSYRDVDHRLAIGALQMGMRCSELSGWCRHSEVVNSGRASNVGVGHQTKITKRRQRTVDRGPMNSRSRCFGPGDNLLGSQVLISAVENFNDRLASSGHALVTVPQHGQGSLDARRWS
jgi:hypothetical protein